MKDQINRIVTAIELEPDPMRRLSMMAVLRQTLNEIERLRHKGGTA